MWRKKIADFRNGELQSCCPPLSDISAQLPIKADFFSCHSNLRHAGATGPILLPHIGSLLETVLFPDSGSLDPQKQKNPEAEMSKVGEHKPRLGCDQAPPPMSHQEMNSTSVLTKRRLGEAAPLTSRDTNSSINSVMASNVCGEERPGAETHEEMVILVPVSSSIFFRLRPCFPISRPM